jgi:hypothetical protein
MVETLSLRPLPKMHQTDDSPLGEAISKTKLGRESPSTIRGGRADRFPPKPIGTDSSNQSNRVACCLSYYPTYF